ncbi:MAG: hypothetical protein QGH83_06890 [Candidatus Pacebacteria bacterium]|jgi:hypothetical protein|nr:hypothetical protein [Candidatus Paceibacterota bacterium]|tara:strand:+ start:229 stop:891 length:663 start_codon:yes stop_codon:yes gene_type:complete
MITFPREKVAETNRTFKAWKTYQAMYLHFTGSYDYFKYYGNASWGTIASMEKYFAKFEHQTGFSWQRGFFTSLGKKYVVELDLIYYYLSQITIGKMYPTEFLDDYFIDYKNKMESFSLHLQRNMKVVVEYMKEYDLKFNELFESEGINHPPILKLLLGEDISLETFTVLDICLDFTKALDKKLIDPIWRDQKTLCYNYKPFLEVNVDEKRKLIRKVLDEN